MNIAQELFHAGQCCVGALQAGRAPDRWRQDWQQQTASLKALPQQCHWITTVTQRPPQLQDQPLLGSCLPSLTGGRDRPTAPPPSATPARSRPTAQGALPSPGAEPDCPPAHRLPRRSPAVIAAPDSPQRSPTADAFGSALEPLRLPAQARAELLQSCHQPPPVPPPLPESDRAATPLGAVSTPKNPPQPRFSSIPAPARPPQLARDICLDSTYQQRWRQQLIHRTDECLRAKSDPLNVSVPQLSPQPDRSLPSTQEESLSQLELELSHNAWAHSLGTTVPLALLTHLVTPQSTLTSSDERTAELDPQPRSPLTPATQASTESPALHLEKMPTHSPLEALLPGNSRSMQSHPATAERERINPPTVAPGLPPLVAPQTHETPPSVTTPLIQQQAKQEALPAADLDELAGQIKRILDEEARRYGINV